MNPIVSIRALTKTYASGLQALKPISLDIHRGEIFAMLGPNGAGKTTLIGIICGLVRASGGTVQVDGFDTIKDYRKTRSLIGLVPQELHTDTFEKVISTLRFSRGLFGLAPNDAHLDAVLKELSLFDKRNEQIKTLSGGMKRRVLIAKALSHEPRILFLDEPTAGVDVELRYSLWGYVRELNRGGMTILRAFLRADLFQRVLLCLDVLRPRKIDKRLVAEVRSLGRGLRGCHMGIPPRTGTLR